MATSARYKKKQRLDKYIAPYPNYVDDDEGLEQTIEPKPKGEFKRSKVVEELERLRQLHGQDAPVWEHLQSENDKWFEYFRVFRDLPAYSRSIEAAHTVLGLPVDPRTGKVSASFQTQAAYHKWYERARAYDEYLNRLQARTIEAKMIDWATRYAEQRSREYKLAQRMLNMIEARMDRVEGIVRNEDGSVKEQTEGQPLNLEDRELFQFFLDKASALGRSASQPQPEPGEGGSQDTLMQALPLDVREWSAQQLEQALRKSNMQLPSTTYRALPQPPTEEVEQDEELEAEPEPDYEEEEEEE